MQLVAAHFEVQLFTEHTNHTHIFFFSVPFPFLSFSFISFFSFFSFSSFYFFCFLFFFLFVISLFRFSSSFLSVFLSLSLYASISTQTRVYTHVWPCMHACFCIIQHYLTFWLSWPASHDSGWLIASSGPILSMVCNPEWNGVSSLVGYHHAAAAAAAAVGAAEHNYLVLIAMMTWQ